MMKEAKDDAELQRRIEKKALRAQEEAKIRKGEELVMSATKRMLHRDDEAVEKGKEDEHARLKKKLRDNVRLGARVFTREADALQTRFASPMMRVSRPSVRGFF